MFNENGASSFGQRIVTKFAVFSSVAAFLARMEVLAREVLVHIQAFLLFSTAIHQIELAKLHFARWQGCM